MSKNKFSYEFYDYTLDQALEKGFRVSSFQDYDSSYEKTIIMRHDIDYNLNGLMQLAEIESKKGITATYLFRVHAHEYNIFSHYVYQLLKDLQALNHEIGLHFEAMTFARAHNLNDPQAILKKEKAILEAVLERPILTASEHRDVSHTIHGTPYYHEFYDPYQVGFKFFTMDPQYFSDMKYLSDSNGIWREGHLQENLDKHSKFQVLIHPEWCFNDDLLIKGPYFHGLGN